MQRKAIATHIVVLFVMSVFFTFFLIFVLNVTYGEDPKECFSSSVEIKRFCTSKVGMEIVLSNPAGVSAGYLIRGSEKDIPVIVESLSSKTVKIKTNGDDAIIYPIVNVDGENIVCKTQPKKLKFKGTKKC